MSWVRFKVEIPHNTIGGNSMSTVIDAEAREVIVGATEPTKEQGG